jgi:hypothetical protein
MSILFEAIYGKDDLQTYTLMDAFKIFRQHRLIDEGEFGERSVSALTGIAQCSRNTEGIDLVNGVQLKTACTNYATQNRANRLAGFVSIAKPRADRKTVYVVVIETETEQEYFFKFPYESYGHMNANTLAIPFELDGTPRYGNWTWDYEVSMEDFVEEIQSH